MSKFSDMVEMFMSNECPLCNKYSPIGKVYFTDRDFYKGNYWFYETEDFIVDIHDFYIKKDYVEDKFSRNDEYPFLVSSYVVSGSGEWINPYQFVGPASIFVIDPFAPQKKYILHGNCRFLVVGMKFKLNMIEKHLPDKSKFDKVKISKIFIETQNNITKPIGKIAQEILECKMDGISAELFFEAKAKEWLSITIDSYENYQKQNNLNEKDKIYIESVAKYIEDHFAFDISQEFLEKIASMSGTKLKDTFKQQYKMSITEFTQRKRMNIAENLLLTTDLNVKDIAKSVGYNSASRFSTLFRRYKGIHPKDVKKFSSNYNDCNCLCNLNKNLND